MSVTPYSDLTTQDILSAHISGLSHSINKVEKVLDMKTESSTFNLLPVTNQTEVSLRYRIYEGNIRNWLSFSLRRDGVEVPGDEYEAQLAFGVIIFNSPQLQTAVISVTATHVISESKKIESIETSISSISENQIDAADYAKVKTDLIGATTDIVNIKKNVTALETKVDGLGDGSSSGGVSLEDLGLISLRNPEIISNVRPQFGGDPGTFDTSGVLVGSVNMDSFPIIITETTTFSKMSITFSAGSTNANSILGIYSNDPVKTAPNKLIATTASFRYENTVKETKNVSLTSPITLEPGIYWLTRWSNDSVMLEGHVTYPTKFISIIPPHGLYESSRVGQNNGTSYAIGVRSGAIGYVSALPGSFPTLNGTDAFYLIRGSQGTIKLLV